MLRRIRDTYLRSFAGLPRPVWALSVAALVNRSGTMVLSFLALYLTRERGLTPAEAGDLVSAYGLGAIVAGLVSGALCDRIDPRSIQVGSLVLGGLLMFLIPGAADGPALVIVLVAWSLTSEAFRPANAAALSMVSPRDQRTRAFALNRLAVNLGTTIGPPVGGFLAVVSYTWLFVVDGLTCILSAVLLARFFRIDRRAVPGEAEDAEAPSRSPWRDRVFLAVLALNFLTALAFFQLFGTYTLYLSEVYGYSEKGIGLLLTVNTVVIILFEMVLIDALAGRRELRLIAWGTLFLGGGFWAMTLGESLPTAIAAVLVWTVGEMLALPLVSGWVAKRAGPRHRGRYLGLFNTSFAVGFVVAPLVGTRLYEQVSPATPLRACGLVGILTFLGYLLLDRFVDRDPGNAAP